MQTPRPKERGRYGALPEQTWVTARWRSAARSASRLSKKATAAASSTDCMRWKTARASATLLGIEWRLHTGCDRGPLCALFHSTRQCDQSSIPLVITLQLPGILLTALLLPVTLMVTRLEPVTLMQSLMVPVTLIIALLLAPVTLLPPSLKPR